MTSSNYYDKSITFSPGFPRIDSIKIITPATISFPQSSSSLTSHSLVLTRVYVIPLTILAAVICLFHVSSFLSIFSSIYHIKWRNGRNNYTRAHKFLVAPSAYVLPFFIRSRKRWAVLHWSLSVFFVSNSTHTWLKLFEQDPVLIFNHIKDFLAYTLCHCCC